MNTQPVVYSQIPVAKLSESPLNNRKHFDPAKLTELADNIKLIGVKAPILCRPLKNGKPWLDAASDEIISADGFEIAAGHRRLRAAKLAKLDSIPAVIQPMSDDTFLEVLLVENLQHVDVHPLDEANGYQELLKRPGYDAAVISSKTGKDLAYIYKRLSLTRLIAESRKAFWEGVINIAMADIIARLTPEDQKTALKRISSKEHWTQIKTARDLREWVAKELMLDLAQAAFSKDDADLVPAAGACTLCPKRTGFTPELFPDVKKKDVCTDRKCFEAKRAAYVKIQIRTVAEANRGEEPILVSTAYENQGGTLDGKPVLGSNRWTEVKKKGKCAFGKPALVVRGDERVGAQFDVCTNPRCPVHAGRYNHSNSATPKQIAEQAKRAFDQKIDEATRQIMLDKTAAAFDPKKVSSLDLRLIAALAYQRWGNSESRKAMSKKRTGKEEGYLSDKNGMSEWMRAASADDLLRLVFESALGEGLHYYSGSGHPDELALAARRWKVKPELIRVEVTSALRTKQKAAQHRAAERAKEKVAKEKRAAIKAAKTAA